MLGFMCTFDIYLYCVINIFTGNCLVISILQFGYVYIPTMPLSNGPSVNKLLSYLVVL